MSGAEWALVCVAAAFALGFVVGRKDERDLWLQPGQLPRYPVRVIEHGAEHTYHVLDDAEMQDLMLRLAHPLITVQAQAVSSKPFKTLNLQQEGCDREP